MPIKIGNKEYYPLTISKIKSGNKIVYDRNTRGKSWFYLSFIGSNPNLITNDNRQFHVANGGGFLVDKK